MTKRDQHNLVRKLCNPREMMYVQKESVFQLIQVWFLMNSIITGLFGTAYPDMTRLGSTQEILGISNHE